jgi:hypothetical protein
VAGGCLYVRVYVGPYMEYAPIYAPAAIFGGPKLFEWLSLQINQLSTNAMQKLITTPISAL